MPQGMPYPKGDMSMKGGKSMRDMLGMGKEKSKPAMPMKGKKSGKMMGMKRGKSC
jgi:hypothetical protein